MSDLAPVLPPSADSRLERAIGPWALGANAVNLTVAAGIFALPAVVAAMLGPAAILAYAICALLIVLVLACFAEVGASTARSGGAVAYVEDAFGPQAGFVTWVVFAIAYSAAADAAIANVVVGACGAAIPAIAHGVGRVLALVALFGGIAAVNVRGVRQGTRLSIATTVAKLLPLLLVIVLAAPAIAIHNLTWTVWPSPARLGEAALVLFFAFGGPESALTPSGEIRDPARTVPRGILGAVAAVLLLYVALQVAAQGVMGADLTRDADAPIAALAARLAGGIGRNLVIAGTVVAGFGAIAADILGTPRAFLVAAQSGSLPRALATVHARFRTPWISILVYAGIGFLLSVSGGFRPLAVLSSMSLLLVYLAVCLASLRLRYTRVPTAGAFRLPGGPTVAVLAVAVVVWLLAHSSTRETIAMTAVIVGSMLYYQLRTRYGGVHAPMLSET